MLTVLTAGPLNAQDSGYVPAGGLYAACVKPDGDTVWTIHEGLSAVGNLNAVCLAPDGSYVVAGHTQSLGADSCNFYLARIGSVRGYACGDADGNGIVNISDAVYLITYILGGGPSLICFWPAIVTATKS